jgi:hypothetical protein
MADWTENLSKEDQENWKKSKEAIAKNEAMRKKEEPPVGPEVPSPHSTKFKRKAQVFGGSDIE